MSAGRRGGTGGREEGTSANLAGERVPDGSPCRLACFFFLLLMGVTNAAATAAHSSGSLPLDALQTPPKNAKSVTHGARFSSKEGNTGRGRAYRYAQQLPDVSSQRRY